MCANRNILQNHRILRQHRGGSTGRRPLNASVVLENKEHRDLSNLPLIRGDLTSLGSTKVRRPLLDLSAFFVCCRWEENSLLHTLEGRGEANHGGRGGGRSGGLNLTQFPGDSAER